MKTMIFVCDDIDEVNNALEFNIFVDLKFINGHYYLVALTDNNL